MQLQYLLADFNDERVLKPVFCLLIQNNHRLLYRYFHLKLNVDGVDIQRLGIDQI
jgi:hypothetical protein